jgi:hypothetical protein
MARNGKSINVKIATAKVIRALETKLLQLKQNKDSQQENEDKHKKAMEKWHNEIGKLALTHMGKAVTIRAYVVWDGTIKVDFVLPKDVFELPVEPERDFETMTDYQYKEMTEEIENAIRILKMTEEETVSASTYNSIARYL